MKKCKNFLIFFALAVGLLIFCGSFAAFGKEKPIEWRLYTFYNTKRPEYKFVAAWADRVNERAGGKLKVTTYPGGALGFKPADILRVMQGGHVEAATIYDGYLHRDDPAFGALMVQGVYSQPDDYKKIVAPLREIKKKKYAKWGIVYTGMMNSIIKWIYIFSKEPMDSLDSMRGKKIRVWSKDLMETLTELGVSAQIIPQADLYLALKTGVVDGATYATTAAKSISLHEVTKYASKFFVYASSLTSVGISKPAWESLPEDLKKVVLEAGDWVWDETTKVSDDPDVDKPHVDFLKDKGMVFLDTFPQKDRKLLQKTALETWESLSKKAGSDAVENYRTLKEALLR